MAESSDTKKAQAKAAGTKKPVKKGTPSLASLEAKLVALQASADSLQQEAEGNKAAFLADLKNDPSAAISFLLKLIESLDEKRIHTYGYTDKNSTLALLDMLSDKKATMNAGTQPGSYRYYSASHPRPEHQGQRATQYVLPQDGTTAEVTQKIEGLDPEWIGQTVEGFVPQVTLPFEGAYQPEAQLGKIQPSRGIRILTSNRSKPTSVTPTNAIQQLVFSQQDVLHNVRKSNQQIVSHVFDLGPFARDYLFGRFSPEGVGKSPSLSDTTASFYGDTWLDLKKDLRIAMVLAGQEVHKVKPELPIGVRPTAVPAVVSIGTVKISTSTPLSEFAFQGSSGTKSLGRGTKTWSLQTVMEKIGASLAKQLLDVFNALRESWVEVLRGQDFTVPQTHGILSVLNASLASSWGIPIHAAFKDWETRNTQKTETVESPVFPVSDAKGYHVVGTARYGRGVDIEPGGVWDSLHTQDPLSLLDRHTLDQVLNLYVLKKESIVADIEKTLPGGKVVHVGQVLSGPEAKSFVEGKVIEQLHGYMTDKDILDVGLAVGKNPNMLQLGLSNWFSDDSKEGIHKLPVTNSAYTLADLSPQTNQHVCECKAAEADVAIDAFGQSDFLQIDGLGGQNTAGLGGDRINQYLTNLSTKSSIEWQQAQDAMRGTALDRGSPNVVGTFMAGAEAVAQAIQGKSVQQKQADAAFQASIQQVKADKVGGGS